MAVYREPFKHANENRRPTLTWPRQIPIDGEPKEVVAAVSAYSEFLETSNIPKCFIKAVPRAILVADQREYCRGWPNPHEVEVSTGHFVAEDAPQEVGEAIKSWMAQQGQ